MRLRTGREVGQCQIEFELRPERTFQQFLDLVPAAPRRQNQGEDTRGTTLSQGGSSARVTYGCQVS